jgi:POT family proton-dependent oligopeptide transporter
MNSVVVLVGILITLATGIPVLLQLVREHPRGLFVLFFAEMWERFSYYGMRGLLVFYLTQQFLFDDKSASGQYGSYTTLVYLLPLIGGFLADRYLGPRKAIAFGALLLVFGQLGMAIEGPPAQQVLTYQGARYEFQATGLGDARAVKLKVAGKAYDFAPASDGGLAIKGLPAGAPLPPTLAKGAFQMSVEKRNPLYVNIMFAALALIIMGVGFLKANISSIVGQLYAQGDPRRDPGFTLYYYGVNLGAFWSAVLCGYLGQNFGWKYGFGLAGVGMLAGYVVFMLGRGMLEGKGEPPDPDHLAKPLVGPLNREWLIYLCGVLGMGVVYVLVQHNQLVGYGLGAGAAVVLGYVGWFMAARCTRVERERMLLSLVLIAGAVVFFTLFEQAGTSLNLFADRNTQLGLIQHPVTLQIFGRPLFIGTKAMLDASGHAPGTAWIDMGFNAAQTQSFNAGFILLFAPVFAALWGWLGRLGRNPNPVSKFGLGLVQVGLGFLVIVWSQGLADASFRMPLLVLAFTYLLHTTGELCLSPVGLSEITKLSPPVLVSTMMAVWFLASSAAQFIGGFIAQMAGTETVGGQVLDPRLALATSIGVFKTIGLVGVGCGVAFLAVAPLIKGWAHGVDETEPGAEVDGDRMSAHAVN